MGVFITIVVAFICWKFYQARQYQAWVRRLNEKYDNDQYIVQGILKREFWEEQTAEQLLDSQGQPDSIDKQVMKTKVKEVWKYGAIQKGQFKLRITLENNKVIGWELKGQ